MMFARRALLRLSAVAAACVLAGGAVQAQQYPSQPIRMVIPFPPGGPNDLLGRPVAQRLSAMLGQPVVVENRAGANGVIGSALVAKAAPDGYTMLFMSGAHSANPSIQANMPFDPVKDFTPITQIVRTYGIVLAVRHDFPARNLAEFVKMAKAAPGKYSYGNAGIGNANHVAVELFKSVAGVDMLAVPYKGTSEMLPALLGGEIDLVGLSVVAGMPLIKDGRLRALALTGETRVPALPDVPTFADEGYPEVKLLGYYGMWFPAKTPDDRVQLIYRSVKQILDTPEMEEIIAKVGARKIGSTPEEFAAFVREDVDYQTKVNERVGLTPK